MWWSWGTIKRLAARASLQRAIHNQILNPHQLYGFAKSEIPSITCLHAFLLISSKLMLFQSFWPPDIKMLYNLEEAEKRSVYSQWWQYFNVSNFRNRFSSIKFDWRFTSISKYWRSNTTKVLCLSLQKQLVLWKSKLCFDWE